MNMPYVRPRQDGCIQLPRKHALCDVTHFTRCSWVDCDTVYTAVFHVTWRLLKKRVIFPSRMLNFAKWVSWCVYFWNWTQLHNDRVAVETFTFNSKTLFYIFVIDIVLVDPAVSPSVCIVNITSWVSRHKLALLFTYPHPNSTNQLTPIITHLVMIPLNQGNKHLWVFFYTCSEIISIQMCSRNIQKIHDNFCHDCRLTCIPFLFRNHHADSCV